MMTPRRAMWLWIGILVAGMTGSFRDAMAAPQDTYAGEQAALPVTFGYPADWRLQEESGTIQPYEQVRLLGPRNHADTYTAYIALLGAAIGELGQEARAEAWVSRLPDGARVEARSTVTVDGLIASEVVMSQTIPSLHLHGQPPSPEIPVMTRALFFHAGVSQYEFIYSADAREFASYAPICDALLASLHVNRTEGP